MERLFFSVGALLAGLAVAAGAYGAHGAVALGAEQAIWINKAARYQMYHGLALLMVAWAYTQWPGGNRLFNGAGFLFLLGVFSFSGSLYVMAFTGMDLGLLTPFGGIPVPYLFVRFFVHLFLLKLVTCETFSTNSCLFPCLYYHQASLFRNTTYLLPGLYI
jgi:uncharacterized membrane protein YgdD (TMEM256/DUF423 family)